MEAKDPARAWYRQPVVWMVIAIPIAAVAMGLTTLYLAVVSNDGLVADDYYWQGQRINLVLDRDRAAARRGLASDVTFDYRKGDVRLRLHGHEGYQPPPVLAMKLYYATRSGLDQSLTLVRAPDGAYRAALPRQLTSGHWYVQIEAQDWRLVGSLRYPGEAALHLGATPKHRS